MIASASPVSKALHRMVLGGALIVLTPFGGGFAEDGNALEAVPPAQTWQEEEAREDRRSVLAGLYERLGQAEDAESAAPIARTIEELWLTSGSETVDVLMARVFTLVQDNDYDQAIEILDSITLIAPGFAEGWNQRATVYFLKRDYNRSLKDLRQVLALDPSHFKAINGLALILQELGNKSAALKAYRKALQVHPHLGGASQAVKELEREVEGQGI